MVDRGSPGGLFLWTDNLRLVSEELFFVPGRRVIHEPLYLVTYPWSLVWVRGSTRSSTMLTREKYQWRFGCHFDRRSSVLNRGFRDVRQNLPELVVVFNPVSTLVSTRDGKRDSLSFVPEGVFDNWTSTTLVWTKELSEVCYLSWVL